MRSAAATRRSGFTLIEVMVALGLFALIALAGFTLLEGIIGTRDRLDGRLTRVAELQRAMYLVTLDFEAIDDGSIEVSGNTVSFRRLAGNTSGGGTLSVRYALTGGALHRQAGAGADQTLITGVESVDWSFMVPGQGWGQQPTQTILPLPGTRPQRARAVAMTVVLADAGGGLSGPLRRVVELPVQP